jgi:hypothetical protein
LHYLALYIFGSNYSVALSLCSRGNTQSLGKFTRARPLHSAFPLRAAAGATPAMDGSSGTPPTPPYSVPPLSAPAQSRHRPRQTLAVAPGTPPRGRPALAPSSYRRGQAPAQRCHPSHHRRGKARPQSAARRRRLPNPRRRGTAPRLVARRLHRSPKATHLCSASTGYSTGDANRDRCRRAQHA